MAVVRGESLSFDDVLIVPQKSRLDSRKHASLGTWLTYGRYLKIPIISANMAAVTEYKMAQEMARLGGFGFIHRFMTPEENVKQFLRAKDSGAGIGVTIGLDDMKRFNLLYAAGAKVFLLDVAHAHSNRVLKYVENLKRPAETALIVGNIATAQAVQDFEAVGVDGLKIGIGPGAACTTREVTGAGRGQLTAIMDCAEVANVPLIADGGIRNSGDIVKALAAGASSVMLGRLLAGCSESPEPGGYWGNASHRMNGHRMPEGVEGTVPSTGTLEDTLKPLLWGIRSGMSYAGATTINGLDGVTFEKVGGGVAAESGVRI